MEGSNAGNTFFDYCLFISGMYQRSLPGQGPGGFANTRVQPGVRAHWLDDHRPTRWLQIRVSYNQQIMSYIRGKNFKQSMLSYCKLVLQKMSFSKKLFLKEYRKSLTWLDREEERNELRRWARDKKNDVSTTP
jgi:hypothetical protein